MWLRKNEMVVIKGSKSTLAEKVRTCQSRRLFICLKAPTDIVSGLFMQLYINQTIGDLTKYNLPVALKLFMNSFSFSESYPGFTKPEFSKTDFYSNMI